MIITNIEIKTASNGNSFKVVYLADKAYGKDRTNVFSNHPLYGKLLAGYDILLDQLEVNQKGYLELKGGERAPKAQNAPSGGFTEQDRTRMMRIEALCQHINEVINREFEDNDGGMPIYPAYKGAPNFGTVAPVSTEEEIDPNSVPF